MKHLRLAHAPEGFLPILVQTIVWISLVACVASGCGSPDDQSQLQVENLRLTKLPSGAKILSGSVHNGSKAEVAGALVQISLFDEENNLLKSVTIGVKEIAAGGDQRFREPVDSDLDVQRARVKKLVAL